MPHQATSCDGRPPARRPAQAYGGAGWPRRGRAPPSGERRPRRARSRQTVAGRRCVVDERLHRVDGVARAAARRRSPRARRAAGRAGRTARTAGSAGSRAAGMNCTAWNSVRANALTNSPSAVPSTASTTATTTEQPDRPGDVEAEQPDAERRPRARPARRRRTPKASGVAAEEVELAHRHREQPLEGAGGALAQRGHAGHQEHHDEREHRQQRRAEAGRRRRRAVLEHPPQQRRSARRAARAASRACGGRGAAGSSTRRGDGEQ